MWRSAKVSLAGSGHAAALGWGIYIYIYIDYIIYIYIYIYICVWLHFLGNYIFVSNAMGNTKQTHSKYCIFIDISYKYTTEKKRKIILKFELLDAGTPPAPSSSSKSAIMGKAKKDRAARRGADGGGSAASSKNNTPSKKAKVRESSPDADSTGNATATASDEEPTEVAKQVSAPFFISIYCFQINILTISACCSPSQMHWTSSRTFSRAFSRPCRRRRRPSTSSPLSLPWVVGGVAVRLRRQLLGALAVTVMRTAPTAAGT